MIAIKGTTLCVILLSQFSDITWAQPSLSAKWEELSYADFPAAIAKAQGTCVLPFGIIESHGPHLPLGTDLFNIRYTVLKATQQEYAVVFPEYYFGENGEARFQPGAIVYSAKLQFQLLQETTDEMARNGCRKILIANGHGGNNSLVSDFALVQLSKDRDYVVYVENEMDVKLAAATPGRPPVNPGEEQHAGTSETSWTMASRPDLVHPERAIPQPPARQIDLPGTVHTGFGAYSRHPTHYAGDPTRASRELGDFDIEVFAAHTAASIHAIKADQVTPKLQKEFEQHAKRPLGQ